MDIIKKIADKAKDLNAYKTPTIAFLGDSVTQGCFECYIDEKGIQTQFDKNSAYHNYIAQIFTVLFPEVPINIINAGISGGSAGAGYERLHRDVLLYNPDLTVVCFGLNDCGGGEANLQNYKKNLKNIFTELKANGSEVIFMTANMMNTDVSCHIQYQELKVFAKACMTKQREGLLDMYFNAAKEVASECQVVVCDVYAKWMMLYENGVNVTNLLANYLNHPNREMNWLFAYSLVECMFQN